MEDILILNDKNACIEFQEYLSYDSIIAIAAMVVASIGVLITSYVIFVFIKFRDTPVVRASGMYKIVD